MNIKKNSFLIHIFFLSILSSYYLFSYFIFGEIILSGVDDYLDSEIIYNYVMGRFYQGDTQSIDLLLSGEYKWYYFTRIFYPINLSTLTIHLYMDGKELTLGNLTISFEFELVILNK